MDLLCLSSLLFALFTSRPDLLKKNPKQQAVLQVGTNQNRLEKLWTCGCTTPPKFAFSGSSKHLCPPFSQSSLILMQFPLIILLTCSSPSPAFFPPWAVQSRWTSIALFFFFGDSWCVFAESSKPRAGSCCLYTDADYIQGHGSIRSVTDKIMR